MFKMPIFATRMFSVIVISALFCTGVVYLYTFTVPKVVYGQKDPLPRDSSRYTPTSQPNETSTIKCPHVNVSVMNASRNFPRIALFSYPGSGNTWTRHLLQQLTGNCTGSVYCDSLIKKKDFPGECIKPENKKKGCIVYKSHLYSNKSVAIYNKAIILVRNPFDSIKTYFNFRFGSKINSTISNITNKSGKQKWQTPECLKKNGDPFHAVVLKARFNTTDWRVHVEKEAKAWRESNGFWLKTFRERHLLIRYEDLKQDLISTLKKISQFLNVTPTDNKYKCVKRNQEGHYHRKSSYKIGKRELYTTREINAINESIMYVMNITKSRMKINTYIYT